MFIGYTFINELLGFLIKNYPEFTLFIDKEHNWHNIIIYNIYGIVSLFYFGWVYLNLLDDLRHKKWILWSSGIYLLILAISLFYQDPLHEALVVPLILESIIISFCVFLHIDHLKKSRPLPPQQYNLMFWVDRGLLLFHIPFPIIYLCAIKYYREIYEPLGLATALNFVIAGMYLLFTIGFIRSSRPAFR